MTSRRRLLDASFGARCTKRSGRVLACGVGTKAPQMGSFNYEFRNKTYHCTSGSDIAKCTAPHYVPSSLIPQDSCMCHNWKVPRPSHRKLGSWLLLGSPASILIHCSQKGKETNSVVLSPRANYTDWATATCWRNLVPTFADRRVSRGQRGGSPTAVKLSFLDRSRYFSFR
jgi:hypothetical protein